MVCTIMNPITDFIKSPAPTEIKEPWNLRQRIRISPTVVFRSRWWGVSFTALSFVAPLHLSSYFYKLIIWPSNKKDCTRLYRVNQPLQDIQKVSSWRQNIFLLSNYHLWNNQLRRKVLLISSNAWSWLCRFTQMLYI